MYKIFLMLLLFSFVTHGKPIKVTIVSDMMETESNPDMSANHDVTKMDMGFNIFYTLLMQARHDMDLNIDYIPASRLREWRELESQPNVCLYNKVKTPPRTQFAHFTTKPIVAFPPLRLMTHNERPLPEEIDLPSALYEHHLRIGLVEGRSYGVELDKFILDNKNSFIWLSGEDGAKRLRYMFMKNKVDATIEYSAAFAADKTIDLSTIRVSKLKEINQSMFGYIACAKSELGLKLVTKFDELLATEANQKRIIELHYSAFFGNEAAFVRDTIASELKKDK